MQTLISTTCMDRNAKIQSGIMGAVWIHPDLSNVLVLDIYNKYTAIYLTLSITGLANPVYVDFNAVKSQYIGYVGTLTQLLTSLGATALPTIQSLPTTNMRWATYSDAMRAGYKIDTCKIGSSLNTNLIQNQKTDLVLNRPKHNTDMSLVHSHCLVSVNGYYHRTDTDGVSAYIYDGGTSLYKSNMNTVGILSFLDIGAIVKEPISLANIINPTPTTPLKDRIYIKVNTSLLNKTPILVLGGYLVLPQENVWWMISADTWALNPSALPIMERYYESSTHIDLTTLGLDTSTTSPSLVSVAQFMSDTVLRKYLTISQSFIAVINSPNLLSYKTHLRPSAVVGLFTSYQDPTSLLITGYGHSTEYWKRNEGGWWSMSVQESMHRDYTLTYKPLDQQLTVTPTQVPGSIKPNTAGFLLDIGSYI